MLSSISCLRSLQSQAEQDKLTCYYFNEDPLLLIKPVKIEMASLKPDIYLLHDIIRDSDIEFIKVLAGPRVRTLYIILCIWVLKENIRGIKDSSQSFMFEAYLAEGPVQPVVPFNAPLRIRRFFVSSWLVFCAKFC